MKKWLPTPLFFLFLFSCQTEPFSIETQGYDISESIDVVKMNDSIRQSLIKFHWVIIQDSESEFIAEFSKNGGIMAQISVKYDEYGYSIEYLDSSNLSVNLEKMKIHYNFNRWIANLNRDIYLKYNS